MPKPQHDKFCPQCGCAKAQPPQDVDDHCIETGFECGEYVTRTDEDGHPIFRASYTCRTIPHLVQAYEDIIRCATKALDKLHMSSGHMRLLSEMSTAPKAVQLRGLRQITNGQYLQGKGLLHTPDPERTDLFIITLWGEHALRHFRKTRLGGHNER